MRKVKGALRVLAKREINLVVHLSLITCQPAVGKAFLLIYNLQLIQSRFPNNDLDRCSPYLANSSGDSDFEQYSYYLEAPPVGKETAYTFTYTHAQILFF